MKDERNNIDKLFSEGLGDFSPAPPPGMWDRIETGMSATESSRQTGYSRSGKIILPMIAVVFLAGIALLWMQHEVHPTTEPTEAAQETGNYRTAEPETNTPSNTSTTEYSVNQTEERKGKTLIAASPESESGNTRNNPQPALAGEIPLSGNIPARLNDIDQYSTNEVSTDKTYPAVVQLTALRTDLINRLRTHPASFTGMDYSSAFNLHFRDAFRPDFKHRGNIPLLGGIYGTWNMISYGNKHHKQSRSAGFSLSTFRGAWLLETGAEISLSDDNGRYVVNYNSYDSLGYYNKVVSFSPDPANPGTVVFQTKVEGVYDSIGHAYETNTKHRYTYLQIPLMAGYQLYANRLFSISIKAGPVFSMMIGSDEPSAQFSNTAASLESIDNLTPSRVSANWQLAAAAGFGLHVSPRLTLLAEPVYKTYLRPVYQNQRTRPQSFGIKAGLLYRF